MFHYQFKRLYKRYNKLKINIKPSLRDTFGPFHSNCTYCGKNVRCDRNTNAGKKIIRAISAVASFHVSSANVFL